MVKTERVTRGPSVPTTYADDDLADGRAALLSGWSTGSEPGLVITKAEGNVVSGHVALASLEALSKLPMVTWIAPRP